jgi:gamma-glutamylcyclotransferase (GGCT)/AIG2-like uncharacterized protein YtfP
VADLLFVYGSLLRDVPSPMSQYLAARSDRVAGALLPGYLYDVGHYPGFVHDPDSPLLVFGDVLRLHNPAALLAELDDYEEMSLPDREYNRLLLPYPGTGGVWCYVYRRPTAHLPLIESGDYRRYYPQQAAHLAFIEAGR